MNRTLQLSIGFALAGASALVLGLVAHASPEPKTSLTALAKDPAFSNICNDNVGRPDPLWLRQSYENDNCWAPKESVALDGTKAKRAQLVAGMQAAKLYLISADRYQKCISDFMLRKRQDAIHTGQPINATLGMVETHRLVASDQSKRRVQYAIDMAIDDFNAEGSGCPA